MRADLPRGPLRGPIHVLVTAAAVAGWVLVAAAAPAADEFNMKVTAAGIQLGGHVSGPPLPVDGLANRPVLLEFWGIHCPPCIKSMPLLESMHQQLGPQGLVVVGAHAQGGGADDIRKAVTDLKATFTIVERAQVAEGMDFNGIPHCMLFDHTGACVYRGSPFSVGDLAARVTAQAPSAVLEGRTLGKLVAFNEMLKHEQMHGPALKKARGMTKAKDAEAAAEAQYVVEKLEARGRTMLEKAAADKPADPLAAAQLLDRCAAVFKGTDIGTDAAKELRELRKDPAFQAALRAARTMKPAVQ
jgi:thiol-disulfide isomerase/thioredoxin